VQVKDGNGNLVSALTESRVLSLPVGTYFVTASPVQAGRKTYSPAVSGSPVQLQAGGQALVQVTYSEVPAPSFTMSLSPTSLTVPRGSAGQIALTITPQNGFGGQVSLALRGAPSGVNLTPSQVQVQGPTTVPLSLSVSGSVAPGTYALTLEGASGDLSTSAPLTLTVPEPGFEFTLSPTSLSLDVGSQGTLIADLTPTNGFRGTVSFGLLSAPAGVSLASSSVDLQGGVSVPLILNVAAVSLTITPTTGNLALNIQFNPGPPGATGYVVVSGPGGYSQTFTQSQVIEGLAPGTYTITAYAVVIGGATYVPTPPGGTVQITKGSTSSFTVMYAPPNQ